MTNGNGNSSNDSDLFVPAKPGDLITSEKWNDLQLKTKTYVVEQIEGLRHSGVDNAKNAEQFENNSLEQLKNNLKEEFSKTFVKVNDQKSSGNYRRFFVSAEWDRWNVIPHNLGKFPLVETYLLIPLLAFDPQIGPCPFVICHNSEFYAIYNKILDFLKMPIPAKITVKKKDQKNGTEKEVQIPNPLKFWQDLSNFLFGLGLEDSISQPWGVSLSTILSEFNINLLDKNVLEDVIHEFFIGENGIKTATVGKPMEHAIYPKIKEIYKFEIKEIYEKGYWDDIRLLFYPINIQGGIASLAYSVTKTNIDNNRLAIIPTSTSSNAVFKDFIKPNLMVLMRT
jgi:hypothetical protein